MVTRSRLAWGLLALANGCAIPTVIGELDSTTSADATTTGDIDGRGNGYVIRYGDLSRDLAEDLAQERAEAAGSPASLADDALVVGLGRSSQSCADLRPDRTCDYWQVSFELAPNQQQRDVYDAAEINLRFQYAAGTLPDGTCSGASGALEARVVLEDIDEARLRARIIDAAAQPLPDVDIDNYAFTALGC